jgi:RNA-binding protein YlmH
VTKKELLDRCAQSGEERVLLARVLDKVEMAQNRGVPAHTPFLSPGEQVSVTDLLNGCGHPRHLFFGGYEGSERNICAFLPDWQEEEDFLLADTEMPLCAVEAAFPNDASLTHRDILGALMGLGLTREKLGDILLPEQGRCQVVVLREAAPILLSQWESAGRWRVKLREIPLKELSPKPAQVKTIRDTVATPRLDAVLAAGFSMSRSKASAYIAAGKAAINHRACLKGDKLVEEGDVLTCRGLGKCVVKEVPGQSKKGRTMLVLERYL